MAPSFATNSESSSSSRSDISSIHFAIPDLESDSENCICEVSGSGVSDITTHNASAPSTLISNPRERFEFHQKETSAFYPNPDLLTTKEEPSSRKYSWQKIRSVWTRIWLDLSFRRKCSKTRAISASVSANSSRLKLLRS